MTTHADPDDLPEALPKGERILWRGRPDAVALTFAAYRAGWVAAYFGVLMAWRFVEGLHDGVGLLAAASHAAWLVPPAAAALGVITLLGWAAARATIYTVTDRRIVLRIGVALPITLNLPFAVIDGASVVVRRGGTGDVAFALRRGSRIGYAALWPHARAFRFARPEPALRAIPDVETVAARIAEALGRTVETAAVATATGPSGDDGYPLSAAAE